MAAWDRKRFEKEVRRILDKVEPAGVEEAVEALASRSKADHSSEAVSSCVEHLRKKNRIAGEDAIAASRIYEAHILSRSPLLFQLLWPVFKRIASSWVVRSSPERVVIRTPSATGRILCPVLRAADGDLMKARPICEALFRHEAFAEPMSILTVKATGPRIRWEIEEYREKWDLPCYYAIVRDQ